MAWSVSDPEAGDKLSVSQADIQGNFQALEDVLGSGTLSAGLTIVQGNIIFGSAADTLSVLAPGTAGQVLKSGGAGADVSWGFASGQLGAWASKTKDTSYQAATDGFVCATVQATGGSSGEMTMKTDSNNPPTTVRLQPEAHTDTQYTSGTMPVKKGDYYLVTEVAGTVQSIYWIPLGS